MHWLSDWSLRVNVLEEAFDQEFKAATLVIVRTRDEKRWREELEA